MTRAALSLTASAFAFTCCLAAQNQISHGACSPNIANVKGNVTINFTGAGCADIDPEDLKSIKQFLAEYPGYQERVLKELSSGGATMRVLARQVARMAAEARSTNEKVAELAAKVEILSSGPPPIMRALNSNEQDRRAAAETIGEIEAVLKKGGFGLTPQNLVTVGWLYELTGQYDKAAASFLDAQHDDPSLAGKIYYGLAVTYQLQGYEYIQHGDPDAAETALNKAEGIARLMQQYEPAESGVALSQLGFIEKDLASTYLAESKKAKAEEALTTAATLFQQALGGNPKDAGAHNGLGDIYLARLDTGHAIAEYRTATSLEPTYIYAWYDLSLALYTKYTAASAPDRDTLKELIAALKTVLELETSQESTVQKLPPSALEWTMKVKDFAVAEAKKFATGSQPQ